jgi:hypothetical protein
MRDAVAGAVSKAGFKKKKKGKSKPPSKFKKFEKSAKDRKSDKKSKFPEGSRQETADDYKQFPPKRK